MTQTGKKADVEFIIAGEDHVTQVFKGIVSELQNLQNQTRRAGREVDSSFDQIDESARRAGNGVQTVGDRLRNISSGIGGLKQLNDELRETDDNARAAGREMERGFRQGGRAADQTADRVKLLKQRVAEVTREMRGMFDALNQGTAGFQSFMVDQVRRGAYVGGLAVTGFATQSVFKNVNEDYAIQQVGSAMKSSYVKNGKFDEQAYNRDFEQVKQAIIEEGLRKDREPDKIAVAQMALELTKNGVPVESLKSVLPVVNEFAQAHKDGDGAISSSEAAKYLANKLESKGLAYTPENFQRIADEFTKAVDVSSLDARNVLYSDQYTDATTSGALANVDNAIQQAMNVILSKYSIDGSMAGTTLRTLFLESSKFEMTDAELDKASSDKVRNVSLAMLKDLNAVNAAVEADKSVPADQKGNEKVLRKLDIASNYMAQLSPDQRQEVGEMLLGKEAFGATVLLTPEGVRDFKETIASIKDSSGLTRRYADDKAKTDKGQIVALGKAVDELQGKIGRSLNPLLDATTAQLLSLATEGKFSFDEINKGAEASADNLARELNPEIAETFELLTKIGTNTFQVGVALSPLAEGTFKSLVKLLNGDVAGATNEIVLAIDATDLNIENLPGELQGLANAAKNAAIFLAAMVAIDKGITIAENGKKIWDAGQKIGDKLRGNRETPGNLDDDRTIRANVVNVYGGKVNGGGSGSKDGGGAVPVPSSNSEKKGSNKDSKPKPGKFNTPGGSALSKGLLAYFIADSLGLADYVPEDIQGFLDTASYTAVANEVLGNPIGKSGAGAAMVEGALLTGGAAATLAVVGGASYVVADAVEDVSGNKLERRKNDAAGASLWFEQAHYGKYYGDSPDDSARYRKEMKTVGDMIAGYRNRVDYETLNKISRELWAEAEKNMKEKRNHIFGDNVEDVAAYVDRRINRVRNTPDYEDARTEKELRRKMAPEWEQQRKLRGYYDGMPATGMWPTPEPSSKDRVQRIREIENDPFVKGSYKQKLIDELTQRPVAQSNSAATLIPAIMAELNKLQQQPIQVHNDNNLRVVVEDNRAVQVNMESVSSYANRTYNNRTLTPMQAVKMRQLE
ncbi:hypothetical protein [Brevibacillus agri]|uniref:hypothetical protein n=1 Tax=Brevibacillus agri TaxID=51101 RepID=UPI0028682E0C|nr:hypothetical protein [Brevibacillus agri]